MASGQLLFQMQSRIVRYTLIICRCSPCCSTLRVSYTCSIQLQYYCLQMSQDMVAQLYMDILHHQNLIWNVSHLVLLCEFCLQFLKSIPAYKKVPEDLSKVWRCWWPSTQWDYYVELVKTRQQLQSSGIWVWRKCINQMTRSFILSLVFLILMIFLMICAHVRLVLFPCTLCQLLS